MFHRLLLGVVVIAIWFAAGVVLEGCRAVDMPTPAATVVSEQVTGLTSIVPSVASTVAPTSVSQIAEKNLTRKSVWVWSMARLFRLDTKDGMVGERTDEVLGEPASTRNKRQQYFVTTETRDEKWYVKLVEVDVFENAPVRSIPLTEVAKTDGNSYEDVISAKPLLTHDEKALYAVITARVKESWVTTLQRVDLERGEAGESITVFDAPSPWGANVNIALSVDEKKVYVVRTFDESQGAESPIETRVAVVQADPLVVRTVLEVGEPVIGDSVWSDVIPSQDGKDVYLLETIWTNTGNGSFRFVSLGLEDGRVKLMQTIVRGTLDTGCDARWRFVPNGTDLWTWCGTKVQFLDPRMAIIATKLNLTNSVNNMGIADYMLAKDGKTLYTVFPMSREIVVVDLEQRKIIKRAALKDQAMMPDFRRTFARLLYSTAEAKIGGRPMVAMNPDETWIAFSEVVDFDSGDGVWVVDAQILEPIGHWLRGQEIASVRASLDGSELYGLNSDLDQMQVLDPKTGNVLRSFQMPLANHAGMLSDAQP